MSEIKGIFLFITKNVKWSSKSRLKFSVSVLLPRQPGDHQQVGRLSVQEGGLRPGVRLREGRGLLSSGGGQLQQGRGEGQREAGPGGQDALGDGDHHGRGRGLPCCRHIQTAHVQTRVPPAAVDHAAAPALDHCQPPAPQGLCRGERSGQDRGTLIDSIGYSKGSSFHHVDFILKCERI